MRIPISHRLLAFILIGGLFSGKPIFGEESQNWANWRGHESNGVSKTAKPPIEWSDSKNVQWKVKVPGRGSGSPIIWGDDVFVVSAISMLGEVEPSPQQKPESRSNRRGGRSRGSRSVTKMSFRLFCYDRNSGELKWEQTALETTPHEGIHSTNTFASASPITDGSHVFAHFGSRGLFCYTMAGELVWKKTDFGKMKTRGTFGEGSSPALAGDRLIVPWDHEGESFLFAIDKSTGEQLWKVSRDESSCWATPFIIDGQAIMNGETKVRGYDLKTGEQIWQCGGQMSRPVASPVSIDDLVILGSGRGGAFMGAFNYKEAKGDIQGSDKVAWTIDSDTPDIASPLLTNGRVYFHKAKTGILSCVDAKTGKLHFGPVRVDGVNSTYASPIAANGYIYLTGRSGTTVVIKDSEKFEIVATNSVGEGVDATPAPVGNQIFIRGAEHLFCISKK